MTPPKKSKSLQDILKQRSQSTFVGREEQIALFRQNMARSPELRDYFIFNVWGQGGIQIMSSIIWEMRVQQS
jgi:hypothetical protein